MWTRLAALLCAGACFSGAAAAEYQAGLESLRPIARAQVKLTETQEMKLFNILADFSNRERFSLEGSAFSRMARPFHLVTIHVDPQTDFQITNFRLPAIFELNVYSRASDENWRPYWSELISDVTSSFGPDRIATVK